MMTYLATHYQNHPSLREQPVTLTRAERRGVNGTTDHRWIATQGAWTATSSWYPAGYATDAATARVEATIALRFAGRRDHHGCWSLTRAERSGVNGPPEEGDNITTDPEACEWYGSVCSHCGAQAIASLNADPCRCEECGEWMTGPQWWVGDLDPESLIRAER